MSTSCRFCCVWLLCVVGLWPQEARCNERECVRLYQGKKLLAAADCFERLAAGLASSGVLRQRVIRGRALRNAASLLSKAAKGTKEASKQLLLRERAARLLQRYLDNTLYELKAQRESATLLMYALQKQIGYAHLTIVSHNPQALLMVAGYKFTHKAQGRWSRRLRPGRYSIVWRHQGSVRERTITLKKRAVKVVVFATRASTAPVPVVTKRRLLPLVLMAAGGGALLLGGVLLGVAEGVDQQKVQQNLELLADPSMSLENRLGGIKELEELQGQAQGLYTAGWLFFGLGAAALVGAGVVWFLPTKQPQKAVPAAPTPPPATRKASPRIRLLATSEFG